MVPSKLIANHIKTINNESDKAKQEKQHKLKEEIKHRKNGVDWEENEIDEIRKQYIQKKDEELIKLVIKLKLNKKKEICI